jgi:hypothetical protein
MPFHTANFARRWLPAGVLFLAALCVFSIGTALAQAPEPTIRDASLQLWPEYDDPGLLVIFSGDFGDTVTFPREVAFPLPSGARGIQATEKQADGQLINEAWQTVDGNLVYTLPGPGFHIEYYLDRPPSGDQREIAYSFQTPYAIDSLDVRVQQPARATDFSMTPPAESASVSADGLTYSMLQKVNLKPDEKLDIVLDYTKTDQGFSQPASAPDTTSLAAEALSQPAVAPADSFASWLPWLLIGIGLVALAAAAVYWFSRGRVAPAAAEAGAHGRQGATRRPAPTPGPANQALPSYCTQCGRQFRPEDRFCASCGAPR